MRSTAVALVLMACQTVTVTAPFAATSKIRDFSSVLARFRVNLAIEDAARRLRNPECARVLTEFRDPDGHVLADNLHTLGLRAEDYLLQRLWFVDGSGQLPCNSRSDCGAATERGSHVIFVCPAHFLAATREGPVTVIHEMLHSLGLGENPPSSYQINKRVIARCGS